VRCITVAKQYPSRRHWNHLGCPSLLKRCVWLADLWFGDNDLFPFLFSLTSSISMCDPPNVQSNILICFLHFVIFLLLLVLFKIIYNFIFFAISPLKISAFSLESTFSLESLNNFLSWSLKLSIESLYLYLLVDSAQFCVLFCRHSFLNI